MTIWVTFGLCSTFFGPFLTLKGAARLRSDHSASKIGEFGTLLPTQQKTGEKQPVLQNVVSHVGYIAKGFDT